MHHRIIRLRSDALNWFWVDLGRGYEETIWHFHLSQTRNEPHDPNFAGRERSFPRRRGPRPMPGRTQSIFKSASCSTSKVVANIFSKPHHARRFTRSTVQNTSAAVPTRLVAPTSAYGTNTSVDFAWDRQMSDLENALSSDSPSRVWTSYTNLLHFSGFHALPIEVHQQVLQKCSPPVQQLRVASARRIIAGNIPRIPHIHESKFQAIIRNIRASGHIPALDDYHTILSQFAAVGNYPGSIEVYQEAKSVGHSPTAKTVGLVLQAMAHRLTLPITKRTRQQVIDETRKIYNDLLADIREHNIPLVPANMDLSLRILKENMDLEAFEALMRWAYGIDLSYPDRVPLELLEKLRSPPIDGEDSAGQVPMPFSTSALNTTIDFLGSLGNVSKMTQAFEVLTQPLPRGQDHFFSTFEDDEDDVGAVLDKSRLSFTPPHAEPNTTTYSMLIRYASRAGNQTLARHYLNEAFWLNHKIVIGLRHGSWLKPDSLILRPKFAVNRDMLLSVLGVGNTKRSGELMRWLSKKLPRVIRKKKADLDYHISRRSYLARKFPELTQAPPSPSRTARSNKSYPRERSNPIFDLDFDTATAPQRSLKPFDSELHIRVLEKDLHDLENFSQRLEGVLSRTTQRIKERLGRRVWQEKNIWVSTARGRTFLSKQQWRMSVNFKPIENGRRVGYSTSSSHHRHFGASPTSLRRPPQTHFFAHRRTFTTTFVGSPPSMHVTPPSPPLS